MSPRCDEVRVKSRKFQRHPRKKDRQDIVVAMAEEFTQTQTQGSQVEWSQDAAPKIPVVIWGRLYPTAQSPDFLDLTGSEFTLGRATTCSHIMNRETLKNEEILKNISKLHFTLKRDNSEPLSPPILVDHSYNGTFVNGSKIGKGKCRILDDEDEISITHPRVKMFVFKYLQKNEQDQVPREISQKYYVSRTLGQGACGVVKLVYNKLTCTRHAMKIIKKNNMTNAQVNNNNLNNPQKIMNEVNILKQLRHPCIISTEEIFDSRDAVYIVLELMEGGELFDRITRLGRLSERQTKLIFRQMVLAVQYLHSQGITHRDLKPENVLLEGQEAETAVKISDFGLSKLVGEDSFMKTMCGTPLYLAPEILRANGQSGYGPQVDVWSLGVIFFVCLSGYLPFSHDYKEMSLRDQILRGRYTYSEQRWRGVSLPAKMLMRRMLNVRPERRITLAAILASDWMQDPAVISRVEELMSRSAQVSQFSQLSVNSSSDDENRTLCDRTTQLKAKRAHSDTCSSSEPVSKKMRLGTRTISPAKKESNDTTSARSGDSDSSNYLLIVE